MKKIFFAAIPILAAVLLTTSCKNDDIVITQVGSKHDVILNISTKNMYDEFNIANRIRDNYLRDGNNVIGVITYVYDSEGNLVKSQMDYQNNFNNVTQTFINLVEGEYTFITIETLSNSDIDYQAENWSFDDIEKLSTLKITQKYSIVYLGAVLGVVTTNVSLTGNQSVNIIPKAIGSLVNFHPFKFENSEFVKVGFCTTDVVEFYSLNPQLQLNEKIQFLESHRAFAWAGSHAVASHQFKRTRQAWGLV